MSFPPSNKLFRKPAERRQVSRQPLLLYFFLNAIFSIKLAFVIPNLN